MAASQKPRRDAPKPDSAAENRQGGAQARVMRWLLGTTPPVRTADEKARSEEHRFRDTFAAEKAALCPAATDEHPALSALCLSGGGIRSASFALGVLQVLAQKDLLFKFDYLSTVSGGGYMGSFLTAWRHAADDAAVAQGLVRHCQQEAPAIDGLRRNSNYLTPKLGILSADTWTAIALIIRNLILNWVVFLPFFMSVLLIPWIACHAIAGLPQSDAWAAAAIIPGTLLLFLGLAIASFARRRARLPWITDRGFARTVLPLLFGASLFFAAAARCLPAQTAPPGWAGPAAGMLCYAAAFGVAGLLLRAARRRHEAASAAGAAPAHGPAMAHPPASESELLDFIAWLLAGALTGYVIAFGIQRGGSYPAGPLVVVAAGWTMLATFLGELTFIGLRSFDARGEMDREWLARAAGWLSAAALTWTAVSAVALNGKAWLLAAHHGVEALGGVSGIVAIFLGTSGKTAATTAMASERLKGLLTPTRITDVAGLVFALCLAVGVSTLDIDLGQAAENWASLHLAWALPVARATGASGRCLRDAAGAICLFLLSIGLSSCVNVNRFSLHGLYRNRLVRAFLGSARAGAVPPRTPDPFTGFDPADNPRMAAVFKGRPLHIVNVALNIVSTRNLAWQERKAVSFTISPLHAGCPLVGYQPTSKYGSKTGGLTLGTAMTISGAAVSPNMGYHSSPLLSFLLMLFNVRLGCWLGNPASKWASPQEGPRYGLFTMLQELASLTTEYGPWVYLSDGGHFDNLGLYEMVRRRCRYIVVSDAGCDPSASLADLGDSVRKASIDFGVSITFRRLDPTGVARPPVPGGFFWLGTIKYIDPAATGHILYIRPTYTGTETADIRSYAEANPEFPHESTAEQWFGESQFEAYRALGAHEMDRLCGSGQPASIEDLFKCL